MERSLFQSAILSEPQQNQEYPPAIHEAVLSRKTWNIVSLGI